MVIKYSLLQFSIIIRVFQIKIIFYFSLKRTVLSIKRIKYSTKFDNNNIHKMYNIYIK